MDTTVTINKTTAKKLDNFSKLYKCTKKDFINAAFIYFEKYGINPLTQESPAQEMLKLIKRVDQIIAFIKTQEKELLRPACEAIFISEERINLGLNSLLTKQDIKPQQDKIIQILSVLLENKDLMILSSNAQEESFKLLARLIDAKNKTTILNDLSKNYNK